MQKLKCEEKKEEEENFLTKQKIMMQYYLNFFKNQWRMCVDDNFFLQGNVFNKILRTKNIKNIWIFGLISDLDFWFSLKKKDI